MAEADAPFFLTDTGCVRWQTRTLRQIGKDEHFLEVLIGGNPQLLGLEDRRTHVSGRYVAFHQLRLETPQGQTVRPDIIFLTESGHVVVVEVKLSDNDELRDRRVVTQVIDYAASLSAYTEAETVELFGGEAEGTFADIVRARFPGSDRPEELAVMLLERMRSAELHLVIATDGAPAGLREFVSGVSSQSALAFELRVVELSPYVAEGTPGVLLLPSVPVRSEVVTRTAVNITYIAGQPKPGVEVVVVSSQEAVAEAIRRARSRVVKELVPELAAVVLAYDALAEPGLATKGRASDYRQIQPSEWPGSLHYELLFYGDGVGVELHLESEAVKPIRAALEPAAERLSAKYPGIIWDPKWSRNRGRLLVRMTGAAPTVIAETMKSFISDTRGIVDDAIRSGATATGTSS